MSDTTFRDIVINAEYPETSYYSYSMTVRHNPKELHQIKCSHGIEH